MVAVYGGTGYGDAQRSLNRGVDVLVACPGRLEDLVARGAVDLSAVRVVVLDEADRMVDMGFLPAVRRLLDLTPSDRQMLLFSATLGREVETLVQRYQRDPARHDVGDDERPADVTHHFWSSARERRLELTARLVREHGRALVFCKTRRGADRVARQLTSAGVSAAPIHGDRTQAQRERALAAFAAQQTQALVATDVAARGIHVDELPCVVHFDPPNDPTDYLHRSGRTGRAGNVGTVVSLVTEDQHRAARGLQRALGLPEGIDAVPAHTSAETGRPREAPTAPQASWRDLVREHSEGLWIRLAASRAAICSCTTRM